MIIRNGNVFQEDGTFKKENIYIRNHRIVSSEAETDEKEVIEAENLKIIPGLIDIHSHGAAGYDFSDGDEEGLKRILRYERSHGITTWCPTSMSLPKERLLKAFETVRKLKQEPDCASVGGIHMEGPFLDREKRGAHADDCLMKPDVEFFRTCDKASGGRIRLVTLSPCSGEARSFMEAMKGQVVLSMGHTRADYEEASRAFAAGITHVTHLYNAMNPVNHRDPGPVIAAAEHPEVLVELICDGIHVHPAVIRSTFAMFGRDRIILISDSMRATGMDDGIYDLGGLTVRVRDGKATLPDGTLAGSVKNLFECLKTAMKSGIPEGDAVLAATANPAKSIGIYDNVGSITPGKEADLILLSDTYEILRVI